MATRDLVRGLIKDLVRSLTGDEVPAFLYAPEFTGDTTQTGTTISLGLTVDATAAINDVIDVRYRAVGSLTWLDLPDNTLDAIEAAPPYSVGFTTPDLAPDDYEFQAKHFRASPLATSAWSASYTVTLSDAATGIADIFTLMEAA